jgi:hypothetical protein
MSNALTVSHVTPPFPTDLPSEDSSRGEYLVLEEGIDITACHLVICFNKPPNLKKMGRESEHSRGVKALAIESESGAESKESQIVGKLEP